MKSNMSGFTILEVMISIFIIVVVVAAVSLMAVTYFRSFTLSFESNQSISQAQGGLTQMLREIREARQAENGAWPLINTGDNSFEFYADVTNDGRVDRVRYFLDNGILKRGVIEPTAVPVSYPPANESISVVTSYVDQGAIPIFTYYNGNWPSDTENNPLVASSRVLHTRFVQVKLRINIAPNVGSEPFELSSGVTIRSLKDNL